MELGTEVASELLDDARTESEEDKVLGLLELAVLEMTEEELRLLTEEDKPSLLLTKADELFPVGGTESSPPLLVITEVGVIGDDML